MLLLLKIILMVWGMRFGVCGNDTGPADPKTGS